MCPANRWKYTALCSSGSVEGALTFDRTPSGSQECHAIVCPILIPSSFLPLCYNVLETFPQCVLEISDQEVLEWYTAKDFIVGKPLTILGRTFFIYDCDPFTRKYYEEKFGISDLPRIDISKKEPPPVKQVMEH